MLQVLFKVLDDQIPKRAINLIAKKQQTHSESGALGDSWGLG